MSTRPRPGRGYAGIVLYKKGACTQWECNGVRVRSGYIYITDADCATEFPGEAGQVHGAAYRRLFGESVPSDLIASGFSIQRDGVYKYNSWSMNTGSAYDIDGVRTMSDTEAGFVAK